MNKNKMNEFYEFVIRCKRREFEFDTNYYKLYEEFSLNTMSKENIIMSSRQVGITTLFEYLIAFNMLNDNNVAHFTHHKKCMLKTNEAVADILKHNCGIPIETQTKTLIKLENGVKCEFFTYENNHENFRGIEIYTDVWIMDNANQIGHRLFEDLGRFIVIKYNKCYINGCNESDKIKQSKFILEFHKDDNIYIKSKLPYYLSPKLISQKSSLTKSYEGDYFKTMFELE